MNQYYAVYQQCYVDLESALSMAEKYRGVGCHIICPVGDNNQAVHTAFELEGLEEWEAYCEWCADQYDPDDDIEVSDNMLGY